MSWDLPTGFFRTKPGLTLPHRQVVFVPKFTHAENPNLERVADHIEYIGKRCGKAHVGISSDFGTLSPLHTSNHSGG